MDEVILQGGTREKEKRRQRQGRAAISLAPPRLMMEREQRLAQAAIHLLPSHWPEREKVKRVGTEQERKSPLKYVTNRKAETASGEELRNRGFPQPHEPTETVGREPLPTVQKPEVALEGDRRIEQLYNEGVYAEIQEAIREQAKAVGLSLERARFVAKREAARRGAGEARQKDCEHQTNLSA